MLGTGIDARSATLTLSAQRCVARNDVVMSRAAGGWNNIKSKSKSKSIERYRD